MSFKNHLIIDLPGEAAAFPFHPEEIKLAGFKVFDANTLKNWFPGIHHRKYAHAAFRPHLQEGDLRTGFFSQKMTGTHHLPKGGEFYLGFKDPFLLPEAVYCGQEIGRVSEIDRNKPHGGLPLLSRRLFLFHLNNQLPMTYHAVFSAGIPLQVTLLRVPVLKETFGPQSVKGPQSGRYLTAFESIPERNLPVLQEVEIGGILVFVVKNHFGMFSESFQFFQPGIFLALFPFVDILQPCFAL